MISPADLTEDALSLFGPNLSPARSRSVVSRAYYAAFHTCLLRAEAAGYVRPKDKSIHAALREFMRTTKDSVFRRAERRLSSLYDKRIIADYRLGVALNSTQVAEALEEMSEIVDALSPA